MKIIATNDIYDKLKMKPVKMLFSIRNGEIKDSESIAELSGQLGYKSNKEGIQNRLVEILNNKDNCVFVAMENEKSIGV